MALPPHPIAYGGMQVMVVTVVFLTLAVISLAFRLWSRRIQGAKLVFNDYAVIAGTVLSFGSTMMPFSACIVGGLGYHLAEVPAERFALFLRLFVPGQLLWAAANTCVKHSILSLYITIFPNNKKIHYICYGTAAAATCYFISVFLEGFLLCTPAAFTWDKTIVGGTCKNENIAYLVAGITNLLLDIIIVVLPMPTLMGLKMSLGKRLGIIAMFSLGIL
ncbi:hypothetical protein B0I35DRAFT_199222 [Stachybotrys elegans]|uniref:Rhodopsin domain-containing protein n=1 Tax=Stachybotrys elegans TaxID=80388 RepID=A0A8K0SXR6_9HYPO|nr:hypothetical protein B0I35DRAFT_199222 [Stachybotrys elegans]